MLAFLAHLLASAGTCGVTFGCMVRLSSSSVQSFVALHTLHPATTNNNNKNFCLVTVLLYAPIVCSTNMSITNYPIMCCIVH